ncbi:hypothetical protein JCM9140_3047 [Halalkalibacter wakoensis JCM 9140]|uniref:Uncharacterized protein n=1 Tax=Halalkalibacter wakoensis JCM 9140 TaxID=1236970 RepID=W4Q5I0_9BACI|nr:hypothetical protein [Halalkalibacter wakoensis]GAE26938.1 hypothetical protein JCM9140_3047 [Halalkalibacter wakoensis JCM 9140]
MANKTRAIVALIGSFLLLFVGVFRILTDSIISTPLFVAYVFATSRDAFFCTPQKEINVKVITMVIQVTSRILEQGLAPVIELMF